MAVAKGFKSILIISDTHFPYQHPDCIQFLKALKSVYGPDKVIHIGDEVDYHSLSFHPSSPELYSSGNELLAAIEAMEPLYDLFPKMDLIESNHGSMVYRKAKHHGIPRSVFKSYRQTLMAPKGWSWHFDLTLEMSNGEKVYFTHGKTSRSGGLSQTMSMSTVQGHYHERFEIFYWANPNGLFFDLRVGCLVDDNSLAMAYNNTNLKRPILGCAIILDGHPKLCPMVLNKNGRWNKKVP